MILKFLNQTDLNTDGTFSFERKYPLEHNGVVSIRGSVVFRGSFTVKNKKLVSGHFSRIVKEAA